MFSLVAGCRVDRCRPWLAALALVNGLAHAAEAPRAVDVRQLDVWGIRLGMEVDEAVKVAADKLHIDPKRIERSEPAADGGLPGAFLAADDQRDVRLTVLFKPESRSASPARLVVVSVSYTVKWRDKNLAAMKDDIAAKYGKPSWTDDGQNQSWCLHPDAERGCLSGDEPVLRYHPGKLTLEDARAVLK